MGDWLIGSSFDGGAHKKYEPNDLRFDECKKRLHETYQNLTSNSATSAIEKPKTTTSKSRNAAVAAKKKRTRLEVFLEICENFKPVFRHFFMENFLETNKWYEKRVNYTRSVATSSIVGYIVGLGDRHVQNILIDMQNADVVHIDLGIAFEQGKILPIPETIPFRLTRDIVDGFGACGVEGIFRNCCESILDLLKVSKEQIMTIFEVLIYDPLHNWSLSPRKAFMLQQSSDKDQSSPILNQNDANNSSIVSILSAVDSNLSKTGGTGSNSKSSMFFFSIISSMKNQKIIIFYFLNQIKKIK